MNKKKALAKNTIIIFLGKLCTQLISFLLLPLYTKYLTTSNYGIVDLITTYVVLLVPLITLELEMSIFRYLVDARGNKDETKKLMSNNFYILTNALSLFSILYLIVCMFFDFPYQFIIWLDIFVCVIDGNLLQVARGVGSTLDFSISSMITGISTILLNILFVVNMELGALGMILSMVIANGLGALYLFIKLKLYKMIDFKLVDNKLIKSMYKYSIPIVPNNVSWWIVNVSDRTIISWFLGTTFNGLYAVSNKFSTIIFSLLGIFNLSWVESVTLHIDSKDGKEFLSDTIHTVTKLFTSICLGMIAVMPFIFPLLINNRYNDAFNYIPILVLGAIFNVVVCLYSAIYIAKKKTKEICYATMVGAVVNVLVNIVLIKYIGLYAAALSTAFAYFVMMIYRYFDVKKYINIPYDKKFIFISVVAFIITIFMYYQKNIYLYIINLLFVIIYSLILNRKFIKGVYRNTLCKLKKTS